MRLLAGATALCNKLLRESPWDPPALSRTHPLRLIDVIAWLYHGRILSQKPSGVAKPSRIQMSPSCRRTVVITLKPSGERAIRVGPPWGPRTSRCGVMVEIARLRPVAISNCSNSCFSAALSRYTEALSLDQVPVTINSLLSLRVSSLPSSDAIVAVLGQRIHFPSGDGEGSQVTGLIRTGTSSLPKRYFQTSVCRPGWK